MKEAATREWTGVTGGHVVGQKALKILFALVAVRVGYAIVAFIVPFYMLFARRGYKAIYRYFRQRHGYTPAKAFRKTYRNHFLFGQMMLDRFAVYAGQRDRFTVENPDNDRFLPMLDRAEGCIIVGAHVGNPELCGYLLGQRRKRIHFLIFGNEAHEVQKNRTATLADNFVRLIPVSDDLSHLFAVSQALSAGEIVSMPADRAMGNARSVTCDFLGAPAPFPVGAFALAAQFNVPVLALFVLKVGTLRYRIRVIPVGLSSDAVAKRTRMEGMARAFARELESVVRQYPEQWFNFYPFWK